MEESLLVGTLYLIEITSLKISILRTNFQFFSLGENFSLLSNI